MYNNPNKCKHKYLTNDTNPPYNQVIIPIYNLCEYQICMLNNHYTTKQYILNLNNFRMYNNRYLGLINSKPSMSNRYNNNSFNIQGNNNIHNSTILPLSSNIRELGKPKLIIMQCNNNSSIWIQRMPTCSWKNSQGTIYCKLSSWRINRQLIIKCLLFIRTLRVVHRF